VEFFNKFLEDELKEFAVSWAQLGKTYSSSWSFQIGEKELEVVNPSQKCVILTVPWAHFDAEKIKRLVGDIQLAKDTIVESEKGLRALGISPNTEWRTAF
jgi:hypothetical protein